MKAAILVIGVLVASPALARPTRIALTRFDGDDAGIGKAVAAALDDGDFEMISAKRVRRTMRELELGDAPSDRELQQLAAKLDVDAVVTGKVERDGHRLRLRIYTPQKRGKQFTVATANVDSAKFRKAVHAAVIERIAAVVPREDEAPRAKPKKPRDADTVVVADDPVETAPAKHEERAPVDEAPAARVMVAANLEPPASHAANRDAIRLDAGASLLARSLQFATTRTFDNAPRPYTTRAVPGARIDAELYPFAFVDPHGAAAGLGVAIDFDQSAALALHPTDDPTTAVKATQRSYSVGVRYRIPFGGAPTSPTLTLGAGYGERTFAVAGAMALDVPGIDDKLFDPGLAFRLPLGSMLAVTLGGRALIITSGGPIESADQYGHATMLGGEASLGLEILVRDRVALRLAGEATQIDYRFSGTGMLATSRDGDPSTIDVKSAIDRYIGGTATLAVLY
jgi:hypothetical protein